MRRNPFNITRNPSNQPPSTDTTENSLQTIGVGLSEEFHAYGPLAGNHVGVVVGGNIDETVQFLEPVAFGFGFVKVLPVEENFTS
jgi:hypothetical protein